MDASSFSCLWDRVSSTKFYLFFLLGLLSPVSHWVYGVCSWCYCLALFSFLSIRFLWLPFQVFRFSSSTFVCFPLFLIQNEEVWGSTQKPKAKRRGIVEMCYPSPNECFLIPKLHSSALGFVFLRRWQKLNFRLSSSLCVCVLWKILFCEALTWIWIPATFRKPTFAPGWIVSYVESLRMFVVYGLLPTSPIVIISSSGRHH